MEDRRQHVQTRTYVDGNTVRKLEAAPDYRREREERRQRETDAIMNIWRAETGSVLCA